MPQDFNKAVRLASEAVEKDYDQAYSLLIAGYERGNAYCAGRLGFLYEKGLGVVANQDEAFRLYRESAEFGSVFGAFRLGLAYHKGIGTRKDKNLARQWYQQAANKGHEKAAEKLAKLKGDFNRP